MTDLKTELDRLSAAATKEAEAIGGSPYNASLAKFYTALTRAYRSNQLQVVPEGHVVVPRESVQEWQAIETAPREPVGQNVASPRLLLLVPPYGCFTGHWAWEFNQENGRWHIPALLNKEAQPTRWMPLPPPPASEGGTDA